MMLGFFNVIVTAASLILVQRATAVPIINGIPFPPIFTIQENVNDKLDDSTNTVLPYASGDVTSQQYVSQSCEGGEREAVVVTAHSIDLVSDKINSVRVALNESVELTWSHCRKGNGQSVSIIIINVVVVAIMKINSFIPLLLCSFNWFIVFAAAA